MNSVESARYENMLSAAQAAASGAKETARLLAQMKNKLSADRAAIMSEWTDRDMRVGDRLFPAGTVTIIDILDHAARAAQGDQRP